MRMTWCIPTAAFFQSRSRGVRVARFTAWIIKLGGPSLDKASMHRADVSGHHLLHPPHPSALALACGSLAVNCLSDVLPCAGPPRLAARAVRTIRSPLLLPRSTLHVHYVPAVCGAASAASVHSSNVKGGRGSGGPRACPSKHPACTHRGMRMQQRHVDATCRPVEFPRYEPYTWEAYG